MQPIFRTLGDTMKKTTHVPVSVAPPGLAAVASRVFEDGQTVPKQMATAHGRVPQTDSKAKRDSKATEALIAGIERGAKSAAVRTSQLAAKAAEFAEGTSRMRDETADGDKGIGAEIVDDAPIDNDSEDEQEKKAKQQKKARGGAGGGRKGAKAAAVVDNDDDDGDAGENNSENQDDVENANEKDDGMDDDADDQGSEEQQQEYVVGNVPDDGIDDDGVGGGGRAVNGGGDDDGGDDDGGDDDEAAVGQKKKRARTTKAPVAGKPPKLADAAEALATSLMTDAMTVVTYDVLLGNVPGADKSLVDRVLRWKKEDCIPQNKAFHKTLTLTKVATALFQLELKLRDAVNVSVAKNADLNTFVQDTLAGVKNIEAITDDEALAADDGQPRILCQLLQVEFKPKDIRAFDITGVSPGDGTPFTTRIYLCEPMGEFVTNVVTAYNFWSMVAASMTKAALEKSKKKKGAMPPGTSNTDVVDLVVCQGTGQSRLTFLVAKAHESLVRFLASENKFVNERKKASGLDISEEAKKQLVEACKKPRAGGAAATGAPTDPVTTAATGSKGKPKAAAAAAPGARTGAPPNKPKSINDFTQNGFDID